MKKFMVLFFTLVCVGCLASCNNKSTTALPDDFSNTIPASINDNIIQNCDRYAKKLGYETGELQKAVLLDETWIESVYCDDDSKKEMLDLEDMIVIFENIRCVVDADTEVVLGRIPYV